MTIDEIIDYVEETSEEIPPNSFEEVRITKNLQNVVKSFVEFNIDTLRESLNESETLEIVIPYGDNDIVVSRHNIDSEWELMVL